MYGCVVLEIGSCHEVSWSAVGCHRCRKGVSLVLPQCKLHLKFVPSESICSRPENNKFCRSRHAFQLQLLFYIALLCSALLYSALLCFVSICVSLFCFHSLCFVWLLNLVDRWSKILRTYRNVRMRVAQHAVGNRFLWFCKIFFL